MLEFATGCIDDKTMCLRRHLFDLNLKNYFEDYDFIYRVRQQFKVGFVPEAKRLKVCPWVNPQKRCGI
jgi:hypothetical protein